MRSQKSIKSKVYKVLSLLLMVIILFYFAVHLSPFPLQVNAQTPKHAILQISPVILNISLSPGKTYNYKITVKNLLSTPLPLHAAFDNLGPTDEEEDNTPVFSELLKWSSIDQTDMIIPAGETKVLTLTVLLPNKIPLGGYYGTLFLEPLIPIKNVDISSVQAKLGVIMLANIGVPNPLAEKGEVSNFSFNKVIYQQGPILTNFRVKNTSLYHFSAKPFIKIKQLFGAEQTYEIEEKIILPGRSRSWEKEIAPGINNPGFYHATLAISTGNDKQVTQTNFFVIIPLYILTITPIILLLIIIVILRKKLQKAV